MAIIKAGMVTTPIKPDKQQVENAVKTPQTIEQMIEWIGHLGLSVMPECPIEAFKQWGEQKMKRPCYFDERKQRVVPVEWKEFQEKRPGDRLVEVWFKSQKTQIGCLSGWNNRHWLTWIDFDLKHFKDQQDLDTQLAVWESKHPLLQEAPSFRSPSGGYRYLIAFSEKPENFGANSGFSFTAGSSLRLGELLTNNGGHTLLPPTVSVNGAYAWERWNEYPPVVQSPENIGLYPVGKKAKESKSTTPQPQRIYTPGAIHLDQLLCPSAKEILQHGAKKGSRSNAIATVANEVYGWINWLTENGISFNGNPKELIEYAWLKMENAASDPDKWQRAIKPINGDTTLNPAAHHKGSDEACWKKIRTIDRATFEEKCPANIKDTIKSECNHRMSGTHDNESRGDRLKQNASVTGDSRVDGDSHNVDLLSAAATVNSVTEVLESGFSDWMETSKLEAIRVKSELSHKPAFHALVSGIKNRFDEVQPDDEIRLKTLIDWYNAKLDFNQALPSMADDILHDASVLNIDPIGIWQYLLPAVLSLAGKRVDLSLGSHDIPAIVWTGIIAESGTGKTRAEKLITSPLKKLQKQAREQFQAKLEEWEETIANWKKENGKKPPKPVERKYLFDVATIQAVMRRQSEQGMNGSLWARDELVGMFQSFGQFNKGDNEALSCLATSWDGGSTQVDRINQEDSYIIESSRLSIAGGLQPGMFKKAFKDPNDSQGLQARFLFAAMKPKKPKRVKGFCHLSEKLPTMYQWLDSLPEGKIKLSVEADQYYDKLYEQIGEQAFNTSMPVIRAWMFKLPSQLLRIALALHLIECYHDKSRPLWTLQKDTLERAVLFAQYYRSTFHIVQTTAVDTDDLSAILLQIWDKAVTRHPEGISTRDAYREIKDIQYLAKEAGRPVAPYTADLFGKLAEMGKGSVVKQGRLIKFVATLTPPPISPDKNGGVKLESTPPGDRLTVAETIDISTSEVSPNIEVSPVTVPNNVVIDVLQNEIPSAVEKAIASTSDELAYTAITPHESNKPDFSDLMQKSRSEISRLKWSDQQGSDYLKRTYGKHGRNLLTDEQLVEFVSYLQSLPTPSEENLVEPPAICAVQHNAIAQPATQPEVVEQQPKANQEEKAALPIYQRSDGGFEVAQSKLRKFNYIGRLPLKFADLEQNEILLTSEMILIEVRRKANPGYLFVTLDGIKCNIQGIRLENLKEIE